MRITGIETHVLVGKLEGKSFGWSQRVTGTRQSALCVVSTDAGIQGLGEAFYFGGPATVVSTLMRDGLGPLLLGCDPMDTSVIWDRLYNWTRDQGQKGLTISALSAIDIALWDIKGQALGVPVYTLLGGAYRHKARVYATGLYEPQGVPSIPAALVEEALGYKQAGFCGMKLKVGYDLRTDLSYIRAIREAIGPDLFLMVDANHAYNASEAIRLARAMEPYDVYWFEEPVPPEDLDGYLEVKRHVEDAHCGRGVRVHAVRLPGADQPPSRGRSPAGPLRLRRLQRDAEDHRHGQRRQPAGHPARVGHERRIGRRAAALCGAPALPGAPISGRAALRIRPVAPPVPRRRDA